MEWPEKLKESYMSILEMVETPLIRDDLRSIIGCGMGGSGFSLLAIKTIVEEDVPFIIENSWEPPQFINEEDAVIAVSYSGETWETIECFRNASDRTKRLGVVAGMGSTLVKLASEKQALIAPIKKTGHPRSSLAQLTGALLALVYGNRMEDLVIEASKLLDPRRAEENADRIATTIYNGGSPLTPIIVSCGELGFTAVRWATELSENSKVPALYEIYPEAGHNFIARWYYTKGSYTVIYLNFTGEKLCRIAMKYVTEKYPSEKQPIILDYTKLSAINPLAAVLQSSMTAGLTSVRLAEKLGRDPEVIEAINEYKSMVRETH